MTGYWKVGRIIAEGLPKESGPGLRNPYREELRLGVGVSAGMLDTCLRLGRLWGKEDVRAAEQAGVSLHVAIALLDFDALAKQVKDEKPGLARRAIRTRRKLVRECPSYRRRETGRRKKTTFAVRVATKWMALYRHLSLGARRRELHAHDRSVTSLLDRVEAKIEAAKRLLHTDDAERAVLAAVATSIVELREVAASSFDRAYDALGRAGQGKQGGPAAR